MSVASVVVRLIAEALFTRMSIPPNVSTVFETAATLAESVDAVAATHISAETGSPSAPGTDATVASDDRGLVAVTPARLVQVQADMYERLGELARGGLGKISRARDLRSGRIV